MNKRVVAGCWSVLVCGLLIVAGCQPKEPEPYKMPEIPKGFESKPGFGGMGSGAANSGESAAPGNVGEKPEGDKPASDKPAEAPAAPASSEAAATKPAEESNK